jgi:hypothetical protein
MKSLNLLKSYNVTRLFVEFPDKKWEKQELKTALFYCSL